MTAIYKYIGPHSQERETIIDDTTALWQLRMCYGEGGSDCSKDKASLMMWAMMNRWNLWPGRTKFKSYLDLIRKFSQPINPRWQRGGDLALKYQNKDAGSPERLKRREYICNLTIEKMEKKSPQIVESVKEFQKGTLLIPEIITTIPRARITNWASLPSTPSKYPHGVNVDGDWFFEDDRLIPGFVKIEIIN